MSKNRTRVKCDTRALEARITQVGERAVKGLSEVIRDYAEIIAFETERNAPHLTGSLERAVRIEFDREGINGRLRARVFIDMDAPYIDPNPDHNPTDKVVGDYAKLMESGLAPHGSGIYAAQEGTVAKGPQAGGRYFARAVEEHIGALMARAQQIVKRAAS